MRLPLRILKIFIACILAAFAAVPTPPAHAAEDCDPNTTDDFMQCVMNGVLVIGTWGRDGRNGGVQHFIDGQQTIFRDKLINEYGVPAGNIYRQAWNTDNDASFGSAPSLTVHMRDLRARLATYNLTKPSYLALVGHSFGGWASLLISRSSTLNVVPDLVFLIDPVIGGSNISGDAEKVANGKLVVNFYQDRYAIAPLTQCLPQTGLESCVANLSCGVPVSSTGTNLFNIKLNNQAWADGTYITDNCLGVELRRIQSHTTIDDDRFVRAEATRLIIQGVSNLRDRAQQDMIRGIIRGIGDKVITTRLAFFTDENLKNLKSGALRAAYRNFRIDQMFQTTLNRLPTDIERRWSQDFFTKGGTSQDLTNSLYLSLDLIGTTSRTISLENILYQYLKQNRDVDKVVEVLLGIDKTVYTYTWNEQEKTCNRSPRNMVVKNKMCGKAERQIQILGTTCDVLYDGQYRFTLQGGQEECPEAPLPLSGPVEPGYYQIKSRYSQKCLDVKDASGKDGAKLQQMGCGSKLNQVFSLNNISGDLYTITAWHSQHCLSAENGGLESGRTVVQHSCSFMKQQNVRLVPSQNGSYTLQFATSGMCVDITGLSRDNGKEAIQATCSGEADQDWNLVKTDPFANPMPTIATDVAYEIIGNFSEKCLDVKGGSEANGGPLQQWQCSGTANQRFRFQDVGDGWYTLRSVASGKCLRAEGGTKDNGARMVIWDCGSGQDQKIRLEPSDNGTFRFQFAHSKKCMDVAGTSADNGKEVHQWDCGTAPDQKWLLNEMTATDAPAPADTATTPPPSQGGSMCEYKHKEDTKGGKKGSSNFFDAQGTQRTCDPKGDWKTSCKDGDGKTDEVSCSSAAPKPVAAGMCQYQHKKDTAGGKKNQTTALDAAGQARSCDRNSDWKISCKDGNGDTDEVDCK